MRDGHTGKMHRRRSLGAAVYKNYTNDIIFVFRT